MTWERRSKGANAMRWWTRSAFSSASSCTQRASRTGTGRRSRSGPSAMPAPGCATSLLTEATLGQNCAARSSGSASGPSRSSNVQIPQRASKSCPGDGSRSASSLGLDGAGDWPRVGSSPSPQAKRGSTSPISASQHDGSQGIVMFDAVSSQPLRVPSR